MYIRERLECTWLPRLPLRGFADHGALRAPGSRLRRALRARFGLKILLKIKQNKKYENLKFWLKIIT